MISLENKELQKSDYKLIESLFLFVLLQYCEKFEICEIISCFVRMESGLFLLARLLSSFFSPNVPVRFCGPVLMMPATAS